MRLIDADKLRKSFKNHPLCNDVWLQYSRELIDNAPTVELTEEQAIDKLHETGWLPRHDKEMTERPQGEWIGGMKCSVCGEFSNDTGNFCSNCGADMRGDKNGKS